MTDPAALRALRERIEKAEGPDREIDKIVARELAGWCFHDNAVESGYQSDTGYSPKAPATALDCARRWRGGFALTWA